MQRVSLLTVVAAVLVLSAVRFAQADHVQGHDQEARGWVQAADTGPPFYNEGYVLTDVGRGLADGLVA